MTAPTVSICIPTYNRPELLAAAIRSCVLQTFSDFEIVVTDNSDNDLSGKVVESFNDPRLRYYRNDGNIGAYDNSVRALSLARGRYVKWLMDDDLIKPDFLACTVAALERNPSAGIAMAPMELIDGAGRRIHPRFYFFRRMDYRYRYQVGDGLVGRRKILHDFLVRDYPCCVPSGVLFRREVFEKVGELDPATDFAGDLDLCMRTALHYDFYYIDKVLSAWRYFPQNHTATLHQKGLPVEVFYYITRKILEDPATRALFVGEDWDSLARDSYFFCTCRALLNVQAAWHQRSPALFGRTLARVWREDPYKVNLIRLPLFVIREIARSLFVRKTPLPEE